MFWQNIILCHFFKYLYYFGSAEDWFIIKSLEEHIYELHFSLIVDLHGLLVIHFFYQNILNDICKNFDESLPQEVTLTVKEDEKGTYILVDHLRTSFGKFPHKICNVLHSQWFLLAITIKDVVGEIPDYIISHLIPNSLRDKRDKLSQGFG